jgi:uncharacterized membrane protein
MRWFLFGVGVLHALFMFAELFPWSVPLLLRLASKKLPEGESFKPAQQNLVASIVHNAGIYNGIVAGGLFWAALGGDSATAVARVMLVGAASAGVFGAATLKSWGSAFQAAVAIIGLILL